MRFHNRRSDPDGRLVAEAGPVERLKSQFLSVRVSIRDGGLSSRLAGLFAVVEPDPGLLCDSVILDRAGRAEKLN